MTRDLTPRDEANLVRIANLRGYAGQLRGALVAARNLLLRNEHLRPVSAVERDALTILSHALEIQAP